MSLLLDQFGNRMLRADDGRPVPNDADAGAEGNACCCPTPSTCCGDGERVPCYWTLTLTGVSSDDGYPDVNGTYTLSRGELHVCTWTWTNGEDFYDPGRVSIVLTTTAKSVVDPDTGLPEYKLHWMFVVRGPSLKTYFGDCAFQPGGFDPHFGPGPVYQEIANETGYCCDTVEVGNGFACGDGGGCAYGIAANIGCGGTATLVPNCTDYEGCAGAKACCYHRTSGRKLGCLTLGDCQEQGGYLAPGTSCANDDGCDDLPIRCCNRHPAWGGDFYGCYNEVECRGLNGVSGAPCDDGPCEHQRYCCYDDEGNLLGCERQDVCEGTAVGGISDLDRPCGIQADGSVIDCDDYELPPTYCCLSSTTGELLGCLTEAECQALANGVPVTERPCGLQQGGGTIDCDEYDQYCCRDSNGELIGCYEPDWCVSNFGGTPQLDEPCGMNPASGVTIECDDGNDDPTFCCKNSQTNQKYGCMTVAECQLQVNGVSTVACGPGLPFHLDCLVGPGGPE